MRIPAHDSVLISKRIKNEIVDVYGKTFSDSDPSPLLLCWGSTARCEMGAYSDLDLILLFPDKTSPTQTIKKVGAFRTNLQRRLKNRLDLLEAYDLDTLSRIASIDGTDRQAILFAEPLCGNEALRNSFFVRQRTFRAEEYLNLREIIHTYLTVEATASNLFPDNDNIKFSRGFMRYFNFIFILARLTGHFNQIDSDTAGAIRALRAESALNESEMLFLLAYFNTLLSIRSTLHERFGTENNSLDQAAFPNECSIVYDEIHDGAEHVAELCKLLVIRAICTYAGKERIPKRHLVRLMERNGDTLRTESERAIHKSELLALVAAHRSKDPATLETLRAQFRDNWYVLYGVANNTYARSPTLAKIVMGEKSFDSCLKRLYSDFAWRNIRLYVAKNRKADIRTLNFIERYPYSRPMDIEAAQKSRSRKVSLRQGRKSATIDP